MLVAFFGDLHGNIKAMYDMAAAWEERTKMSLDLIVQVGDFGFWLTEDTIDEMTKKHAEKANLKLKEAGVPTRPIAGDYPDYVLGNLTVPTPTLVIRGNHEDQEYLMTRESQLEKQNPEDYLSKTIELVPNMFYLPDGHVVDWNGVKFGALGGNFSTKTWANWDYWDKARYKNTKRGRRYLNHFTRDRAEALKEKDIDILLFHDAPCKMGLQGAAGIKLPEDEMSDKTFNVFGCPVLNELIDEIQPQYTFCGHWHQRRENTFGQTTCIVLNKTTLTPTPDCMEVVEL